MALPIMTILSAASSAANLLNSALSKHAPEGFESLLANISSEANGPGAALLKGLTSKFKTEDAEASDALAATGAGMVIFQMMAALKEAGLNAADIQALLTGQGVHLSNDSLKKVLATFGLNDDQIATIMANTDLTNELKAQITQGIQDMIGMKAAEGGASETQSAQTKTTNQAAGSSTSTTDASAQVGATNQSLNAQNKLAVSVQDLVKSATQDDGTLTAVLNEIANLIPTTIAGDGQTTLKGLVQAALKRAETKLQTKTQGMDASVGKAVSTLEGTLGIQKDVLEKLFFATETEQRQAALAEVTSNIGAYLKQQADQPVDQDVMQALSLVRSATTKEEWSTIESAIKLWRPDLQVPDTTLALDQGLFKALAQKLTGNDAAPVFERFTQNSIDQIKIQLPAQVKNGEGVATLKLNPPLLGRVEVNITMEDGQLQATFKTENQCAKDMLQVHIATLKDALADQGIKVTQLTVMNSLDNRDDRQQDAYAQWQHGWRQDNERDGSSGHAEQHYREDAGGDYGETHNGNRLSTSGSLDIFA